jgi:hypothetical protein
LLVAKDKRLASVDLRQSNRSFNGGIWDILIIDSRKIPLNVGATPFIVFFTPAGTLDAIRNRIIRDDGCSSKMLAKGAEMFVPYPTFPRGPFLQ